MSTRLLLQQSRISDYFHDGDKDYNEETESKKELGSGHKRSRISTKTEALSIKPRKQKQTTTTILSQIIERQTSSFLDEHFIWRWITSKKTTKSVQGLWLDSDPLNFGEEKKTTNCLSFSDTGEFLVSSHDTLLSIYPFDEYRTCARKEQLSSNLIEEPGTILTKDGFSPAQTFSLKYGSANTILWNPLADFEVITSFDLSRDLIAFDLNTGQERLYRVDKPIGKNNSSTFCLHVELKLYIAGSTDGSCRAWDMRTGKVIWSFPPSGSSIISLIPIEKTKLILGFSNGRICIFDLSSGTRKSQAFCSSPTPLKLQDICLSTKLRLPNYVGIHSMVKDSQHPTRLAILLTNGRLTCVDYLKWREIKQISYQTTSSPFSENDSMEATTMFTPSYKNCMEFTQKASILYCVRKDNPTNVNVFDMDCSSKSGIGNKPSRTWSTSCLESTTPPPPLLLEFPKRVTSLTVHPHSDTLVVALYRDPKLRVLGVV